MEYQKEFAAEQQYLDRTLGFIRENLAREEAACSDEKEQIVSARKEMWENVSFRGGFDNAVEAHQVLESIQAQSGRYDAAHKRIDHYRQSLESPYFARVDFTESGYESSPPEKIYIGLFTVQDEDSYETYVYDWRTPIASLFYRYETGPAQFQAPSGVIKGEVSLKRQFEIQDGKLSYFFDSDVNITDGMLREALSHNASPQMRSIVETIQRQQDRIIRDMQNEALFVQGVAGSGKTSVALHRVAFLLYEGSTQKLYANNIVIISPNNLFGSYIANVLPTLGEKNVQSLTFEALFAKVYPSGQQPVLPRNQLLEELVTQPEDSMLHQSVNFFFSETFVRILDRYVSYYMRRMIPYTDLYYDGVLLETRQEMAAFVRKACGRAPLAGALELLEQRLWTAVHKRRREHRLEKLQTFSGTFVQHLYDKKQFGRLLSIKEHARIKRQIKAFTTLDSLALYRRLLRDHNLFFRLARGLELPANAGELLTLTEGRLAQHGQPLHYLDAMPLLYLHLRLFGSEGLQDIRQVVVDEAQDYYPLHFYILKNLFPAARYTVMGDYNQTIEKRESEQFYRDTARILNKKSSALITLNKGFRSSYEINEFSRRFLAGHSEMESFERHEQQPSILEVKDLDAMARQAVQLTEGWLQEGYESVGIICKSQRQAQELYEAMKPCLSENLPVHLMDTERREVFSGVMLMPVYMAKGLEFDAVVLCGADDETYCAPADQQLLYVSCTRALHRLAVLYTGRPSRYLQLQKD